MKNRIISSILPLLCLVLFSAGCSTSAPLPDWSSVTWGPFNLVDPTGVTNPVFTAADVTDRNVAFVADPFLFQDGGTWYLFFEAYNNDTLQGDIGLATSVDGLHWKYDSIVLDEEFHLSYPDVFAYQGKFYMLPETHQLNEVRLYEATDFPRQWKYLATPISGRSFVDPSIFYYRGRWWLFVGDKDNTTLYLYSSTALTHGWVEHSLSPIVRDNVISRPGGRSFVYNENVIIRLAQSNAAVQQVYAYQVDQLDTKSYLEHEILPNPLLSPGADPPAWYAAGMHQFSPWWDGNHWLVAFDGKDANGIYGIGLKVAFEPNP